MTVFNYSMLLQLNASLFCIISSCMITLVLYVIHTYNNSSTIIKRPFLRCLCFAGMGMLCFNRRLGCLQGQSQISMEDLNTIFTSTAEAGKFFKPYKYFRTPFYRRFEKAVLKLHWYDVIEYSYISNRFSFSLYFRIKIFALSVYLVLLTRKSNVLSSG